LAISKYPFAGNRMGYKKNSNFAGIGVELGAGYIARNAHAEMPI
jgi:hypothetical protein